MNNDTLSGYLRPHEPAAPLQTILANHDHDPDINLWVTSNTWLAVLALIWKFGWRLVQQLP